MMSSDPLSRAFEHAFGTSTNDRSAASGAVAGATALGTAGGAGFGYLLGAAGKAVLGSATGVSPLAPFAFALTPGTYVPLALCATAVGAKTIATTTGLADARCLRAPAQRTTLARHEAYLDAEPGRKRISAMLCDAVASDPSLPPLSELAKLPRDGESEGTAVVRLLLDELDEQGRASAIALDPIRRAEAASTPAAVGAKLGEAFRTLATSALHLTPFADSARLATSSTAAGDMASRPLAPAV